MSESKLTSAVILSSLIATSWLSCSMNIARQDAVTARNEAFDQKAIAEQKFGHRPADHAGIFRKSIVFAFKRSKVAGLIGLTAPARFL